MIHMKVRDENVLDLVQGVTGRDNVRGRAFTDIEHENIAVAEFHQNRGVHLTRANKGRRAHENDPHFVRLDIFGAGEPVRRAFHPGRRPDPFEQQTFLPFVARYAAEERRLDVFHGGWVLHRRGIGKGPRGQRHAERAGRQTKSQSFYDRHDLFSPYGCCVSMIAILA
jgi:hypothetical protein